MKFNMGCSYNKLAGYVNVDMFPGCQPDRVWDLETFPWPWESDVADEVIFSHSLEHLGGEPRVFLKIMQELYRICKNGTIVKIKVPHPRHESFLGDPTHVRAITVPLLQLFDRQLNEEWIKGSFANTPLAIQLGVDFVVSKIDYTLDEPYASDYGAGRLSAADLQTAIQRYNNVASELSIELVARKAAAPKRGWFKASGASS